MSLLLLSGMPSEEKKKMLLFLLSSHKDTQDVLLVLQHAVGLSTREELSRIRAAVQNKLSPNMLMILYAPLHMKSIRYEISSIARNTGSTFAHIHYSGPYADNGEILDDDLLMLPEHAIVRIEPEGEAESFSVLQRIFESPRAADKWDTPCCVFSKPGAEAYALERMTAALSQGKKQRVSSSKIIPLLSDTKYLEKIKEEIDGVIEEYKQKEDISLSTTRQIERDFLNSIRISPPSIKNVRSIFSEYLQKYLHK
ncbi:protein KTI12 [Nematocida sp. LUAm3]|nr:protein KTI12 [Nematocida sp. LUAm3]KAI5175410.1 protein KTI12 [Nematocida sp. LUAm2]KAI5177633.1 protein KTI12 [Nematocida sp. LUAm1]